LLKNPKQVLVTLGINDQLLEQYYIEYILFLLKGQSLTPAQIEKRFDTNLPFRFEPHSGLLKEKNERQRKQTQLGLIASTLGPPRPIRETRTWNLVLGAGPVGLYATWRLLDTFPNQAVVLYDVRKNLLDREQMFAIRPNNMRRLQDACLFSTLLQLDNPPWTGNGSGNFIMPRNIRDDGNSNPYALRINDIQENLLSRIMRLYPNRFFLIKPTNTKHFTNIECKLVISDQRQPQRQRRPQEYSGWYLFWNEGQQRSYLELSNKRIETIIDATGGRGAGNKAALLLSHRVEGGESLGSSYGAIVYLFNYNSPPQFLLIPRRQAPRAAQNRFRLFQDYNPNIGGFRGCYLGIQVSSVELDYFRSQYRAERTDELLIKYLVDMARDMFFGPDFLLSAVITTKKFFEINVKQYQNLCSRLSFTGNRHLTNLIHVGDSQRKVNFFSGSGMNFGIDDVEAMIAYLRMPSAGRNIDTLNEQMRRVMAFNIQVTLQGENPDLPLSSLRSLQTEHINNNVKFTDKYPF